VIKITSGLVTLCSVSCGAVGEVVTRKNEQEVGGTVGVGVSVGVALQMSQRRCDRGLLEQSRGRADRAEAAE